MKRTETVFRESDFQVYNVTKCFGGRLCRTCWRS